MTDYVFLDVNESFEDLTGLKREGVLNKRFIADVSVDKNSASKWVDLYAKVLESDNPLEIEEHSAEYDKYYSIKAYRSDRGHFTTLFNDRTAEMTMQDIAHYFIRNMGSTIDFNRLVDFACKISGARIGVLNLRSESDTDYTTVSLLGAKDSIEAELISRCLTALDKAWADDLIKPAMNTGDDLTYFVSIPELSSTILDKTLIDQLSIDLDLSMVVVARLKKEDFGIGDIILFFQNDDRLRNPDLLRLYMSQLGLFIEKNRLDTALRVSQKMFFELAEYAPIGFISCNTVGTINYVNRKLLELLGSPGPAATKQINLFELPSLQQSGFSDKLRECMSNDRLVTFEIRYTSVWGKDNWLRVHISPNKEDGVVIGAHIVTDDITEKIRQETELLERVQIDPLTKAYNRNVLETILPERLHESSADDLTGCFAILDVDDFKHINDCYGHKAGDIVLKSLASKIKEELREYDMLIRTGGDEFLIYLHDTRNKENTGKTIDRIFKVVSKEYLLQNVLDNETVCLPVSCSIGASMLPADGTAVDILMAKADKALYVVKKEGKADYGFFS